MSLSASKHAPVARTCVRSAGSDSPLEHRPGTDATNGPRRTSCHRFTGLSDAAIYRHENRAHGQPPAIGFARVRCRWKIPASARRRTTFGTASHRISSRISAMFRGLRHRTSFAQKSGIEHPPRSRSLPGSPMSAATVSSAQRGIRARRDRAFSKIDRPASAGGRAADRPVGGRRERWRTETTVENAPSALRSGWRRQGHSAPHSRRT